MNRKSKYPIPCTANKVNQKQHDCAFDYRTGPYGNRGKTDRVEGMGGGRNECGFELKRNYCTADMRSSRGWGQPEYAET